MYYSKLFCLGLSLGVMLALSSQDIASLLMFLVTGVSLWADRKYSQGYRYSAVIGGRRRLVKGYYQNGQLMR